ncbi:DNRLRE domain-containing protein [Brevibacillus parabrevis]|jgi:hypothetical protein|uniref:DNRLRE domain-containing protein n=1 Tax=Brevibacillus parabrevis TaxID=54914 RepID=UPI0024923559|nr:DNRLRE domain-containing protein [Brevibacillus parabrevis]
MPSITIVADSSWKDTYVNEHNPTTNYGTAASLLVGLYQSGSNIRKSAAYIKPSLASLPANIRVTSAILKVYTSPSRSTDGMPHKVVRVTSDWDPMTLVSANAPTVDTVKYDAPIATNAYASIDITPIVASWVDGSKPNYGVKIINDGTVGQGEWSWWYNASEHPSNKPMLEVTYEFLNKPPTLTLTSPSDNQTLAEGSTFPIAGEASDADNGNVVTVKYKINNGTARAIASGVSDGSSPLSFAKTLTYSNKRLWDGAVDVTGADLAENVDHVLTVWAEDDQGGKSEEVTRKFRVIWNRPPTISGENGDLGIMEEPPSVEYTVTDPETNPFTITEKINGEVIRTFAGVAGQQETVTIPPDMWLRLEPSVQHELTIEATDSQGMIAIRTYTLTRFVDKIVFSLDFATMQQETKDFFTTDVAAKRLLLTPIWDLPPGAILLVEVCNNAYDAEPTWEDATIVVKLNRAHLFSNTTKTAAQWGINFRIKIEKGTAIGPIYVKGVGGAFD